MIKTYGRAGRRNQESRANLETKKERPRVLIVCEGTKTEPGYFKLFRIRPQVRELTIMGKGTNTLRLVEETEAIENDDGPFDEVWCVFDRDSFPADNYDNAISKIQSKPNYHAAYSNEAFELWFILHFEFLDSAISRRQYIDKLSGFLGRKYEKNNPEIYRLIQRLGNEEQAVQWAESLLNKHSSETPHAQRCPCTTVHLLVNQLREWEKEAKV